MTSSRDVLLGEQRPRVSSAPAVVSSEGADAVALAAAAGLVLDDWQAWVLTQALGRRVDGKWSAFEVGLIVPRQNGKGSILEALELAGLFLFGEQLILHSAHEFKTAQEAFRRVLMLVQQTPDLDRRVQRVRTSHGEEGIELVGGQRLRFVARSTGSGRGFSGDRVILDEAYNLTGDAMAALLPTLSARPNPQVWYASSAGMESSEVLARVRERGATGTEPRLAYFDWSAEPDADLDDRGAWAAANPSLGIRIREEFVEAERAALGDAEFARERLGIWADPRTAQVIDSDAWMLLADATSKPLDPVAFAVDVTPMREFASIAIAGPRGDGLPHVEVVDNRKGTDWLPARLAELVQRWSPCAVVVDAAGPASSLLPALAGYGIDPVTTSAREMGQACGAFYDATVSGRLRHINQPVLNSALSAARKRTLGDMWAWHRKDTAADISPLVAVTLALHGFAVAGSLPPPDNRVIVFR